MFPRFKTTDYINTRSVCNYFLNNNTTVLPRNAFSGVSNPFVSQASSSQGLGNEVNKHTKSQLDEPQGRCDRDIDILASEEMQQLKIIQKGDIVNLSELLFTKNRNYLIRYNDPQLVTAVQLAGKVVVICFVEEDPYSSSTFSNTFIPSLIDVYNDLKHTDCFEVVFVFVGDVLVRNLPRVFQSESQIFDDVFSRMPWTAIPFSDITLRRNLVKQFGVETSWHHPIGIVIDLTGKVLQTYCGRIIDKYGSPAYPFSDEMVSFLDSEDEVTAKQPSLKSLLVSPQRDFVISNNGEKVPIHTLEDKVVALYFYEDDTSRYYPTQELITAYEWLAENNGNFEVVLIYLTDMYNTYKCTNEETFTKTFKTMPWLALPFKDPIHKKLKRLFNYTELPDQLENAPRLVIFGPHGEFIEPCGAELLSKFGVSAYPFTRENLVKLETKNVMELKLEMLCSPTTVFRRKDGSQVQLSHFAGKRVMFYYESYYWGDDVNLVTSEDKVRFVKMLKEVEFLTMLKERYLQMEGTYDEFEVIYIPCSDWEDVFCFNELVADLPWFYSSFRELLPGGDSSSAFFTYYGISDPTYMGSFLLAFGQDGRLVRRTICPKFKHKDFPFYAGSLEDEAYCKLSRHVFGDGYWNMYYEGLLRDSFNTKP